MAAITIAGNVSSHNKIAIAAVGVLFVFRHHCCDADVNRVECRIAEQE